jgi:two-component system LytT family sensor kinase
MILANSCGAAIFVSIIRDQRKMYDELSVTFSAKALKMAERTVAILGRGLDNETAQEAASVIREETGVGAVAITDRENVLAFVGQGHDHHHIGTKISSSQVKRAIRENRIVYADGGEKKWRCSLSDDCPLGSVLSVPLRVDNELIGTINLFEPKNKLFLVTNRTLGEGITALLSDQLLYGRYIEQKILLTTAELKLAQALSVQRVKHHQRHCPQRCRPRQGPAAASFQFFQEKPQAYRRTCHPGGGTESCSILPGDRKGAV